MELITRNRRASSKRLGRDTVAGATLFLIGAVMVFVAVPHLIAGIVQIGGDPAEAAIERNLPVTPDMLDNDIESRRAALRWYDIPQYHAQIAFAEVRSFIHLDKQPNKPLEAEGLARQTAIDEFRRALSAQPADPYAWEQLALMDLSKSGPSARTAQYLRMSIETGPQEPELVVQRIAVAMMAWNALDPVTKLMFVGQIEGAAAYRTRELADMALRLNAGDFIKAVLSGRPDLQARFSEMYFEPEEGSPLFREPPPPDAVRSVAGTH